ncbi:hypothetical protein [Aeromicrobium wangtongii]|uniref:Uncharacterized protein n=1 Tax=Aeromicrobium wangtongii TaxID=2969247 RepID=A0ABY5M893_9ACTN|nr:hypothetical protein [Aeromicrobium wangtongii]MCD9200084.1 hypothetical protein [Aeromicrobium wangtongii]UUP13341.1 hypothetical protein NQV15_16050 [Aeromicrobium wangtongii]
MSQRRLPAAIYWRRRLLLLAVVIGLVWVVQQVTGDDGQSDASAKTDPTTTATTTAAPVPTTPPVPKTVTNGIVDVAVKKAVKPCDPQKVRITPTVRPGQLTRGPVDIGLVVSSTDTAPCTLRPDDAEAIAVISANGTAVWDSTVCKSSLLTTAVPISPQWATMATVQWTGRGSGLHCTTNEGWATPGKYTLQIGTLGGEPGKTTFTLDPRPAPAKTAEPPAAPDPAAPPAAATPAPPAPTTPAPAPPKNTAKPAG